MQKKGKMMTCDRCGAQHFSQTTGEGEADGGFTRWNNFEEAPPMWGIYDVGVEAKSNGHPSFKHAELCAACAGEWQRIMEQFMQNVEAL